MNLERQLTTSCHVNSYFDVVAEMKHMQTREPSNAQTLKPLTKSENSQPLKRNHWGSNRVQTSSGICEKSVRYEAAGRSLWAATIWCRLLIFFQMVKNQELQTHRWEWENLMGSQNRAQGLFLPLCDCIHVFPYKCNLQVRYSLYPLSQLIHHQLSHWTTIGISL